MLICPALQSILQAKMLLQVLQLLHPLHSRGYRQKPDVKKCGQDFISILLMAKIAYGFR